MVRGERKKSGGRGTRGREGMWGGGVHRSLCSPTSLGIDHVTAPAITFDILLGFYCKGMPNKCFL